MYGALAVGGAGVGRRAVGRVRELDGWLRDAGFGQPRKIRVLRLPGLSLRVATKSGSA